MCPLCIANIAIAAVSATSGGGVAIALRKFRRQKQTEEEESDGIKSRSRIAGRMAGGAKGFIESGKGIYPPARRVDQSASKLADGQDRQGISVRRSERQRNAGRAVRRARPAD